MILNDDCCLKISEYLSLHDMANAKVAFRCLRYLADMEFERRTRGSLELKWCTEEQISNDLQLLKNFGPFIKDLFIHYNLKKTNKIEWNEVFSAITCCNDLRSLTLSGDTVRFIKNDYGNHIKRIIKNVKSFSLVHSCHNSDESYDDFTSDFSKCQKSAAITLGSPSQSRPVLRHTMFHSKFTKPKIKNSFKFVVDHIIDIQLKRIKITIHTPAIESLFRILSLSSLECLHVEITTDIYPLLEVISASNSINVLTLKAKLKSLDIMLLGQMNRLNILQLHSDTQIAVISEYGALLHLSANENLEHFLFLCITEPIDDVKFQKIVNTRKCSPAAKCLHLCLPQKIHSETMLIIPSEMLEANKQTIKFVDFSNCNNLYKDLL